MAYSFNTYASDGVTLNYSFTFTGPAPGYLRRSDIRVYTRTGGGAWTETKNFTLLGTNYLALTEAPPSATFDNIKIARVMPKSEPLGSWNTGSYITHDNLYQAFLQQLYVGHEVLDGVYVLEVDFGVFKEELLSLYQEFTSTIEDRVSSFESTVDARVTAFEESVTSSLSLFEQDYLLHKQEVDASIAALTSLLDGKILEIDAAIASMEVHKIQERTERQAADQNLQDQITGGVPVLEASAFSPISWHKQVVENSVAIPTNRNAWSFGPYLEIAAGQEVTVGENSHWTIAGSGESGGVSCAPVPPPEVKAYGSRGISNNNVFVTVPAAVDQTLKTNSDYMQVSGIFTPAPDGVVKNVTQGANTMTVQVPGVYRIEFWAGTKSTVNNTQIAFKFSINGVVGATRRPSIYMRQTQEIHTGSAFSNIRLEAGDVLALLIASTKNCDLTIVDCVFQITKIDD